MTVTFGSILVAHDPSWSVDQHVGAQLRARRLALGLIQQQLAGMLGITCQQLQKYETGANRMTAERLLSVAQVLGVPVDYFFERFDEPSSAHDVQAFLAFGRLLNVVAHDHPEIVRAVLQAIVAACDSSSGAAAGVERRGPASPGRLRAGMGRTPAAGRV